MKQETAHKTTRRSRGTNLSLDAELVEIGKRYFSATRYKSLTGFVEAALRREIRRSAAKIRKAGIPVSAAAAQ